MKKKGNVLIWLLTALLILVAAFVGIRERDLDRPLYAMVPSADGQEELTLWYNTYNGVVYVFLPGYAQMDQVQLKTSRDGAYRIADREITDGMTCEAFQLGESYPIRAAGGFPYDGKQILFLRSGGVATMFLDVSSGSMDYLHEDKTHDEPGRVRLYDSDGVSVYRGTAQKVSGRGQTSWMEEKKPYNIVLQEEADLLGMGKAQKWALVANAKDFSHCRNKLVFDLAKAAGIPYSPDNRWVDLYLNGEYAGLYLLCEKIEVHPNRVDIPQEGSFLMTKDYPSRLGIYMEDYITTQDGASLGILHSDYTPSQLLELWQAAENAMLSEDGVDPVTGKRWNDLIDPVSWAKKFLLEETTGNIDAPMLSQYFYLDGSTENGRICASPPWDYEVAMSRPVNMIHMYRKDIYGSYWNWALYQKPEFYDVLMREYTEVFRPLLLEMADTWLEQRLVQLRSAAKMNGSRWLDQDLETAIEQTRNYLMGRVAVLDSVWLEKKEFVSVYLKGYGGSVYAYLQEPGTVLPELRSYDTEPGIVPQGWFYEGTDVPADPQAPMWEDTTVVFRWEDAPETAEPAPSEPLPKSRYLFALGFVLMLIIVAAADRLRCGRNGSTAFRGQTGGKA